MIRRTEKVEPDGKQVLFILVAFHLDEAGHMATDYAPPLIPDGGLFSVNGDNRVLLPIMVLRMET
jgi:hypothetical protein